MKKLLTSTALIGALVITSTSFAETKFGGNVESTWTTKSSKTTAKPAEDAVDQIGTDIEITFEHTKKLSNGWTAKIAAAIDESGEASTSAELGDGMAVSRSYVQLSNGSGLTLQIGTEGIQGAEIYPIPTVADISSDIGAVGSQQEYADSLNDTHAVGFALATNFGTIEALYAPDSGSAKSNGDANINPRATGSGVEVGYKFKALGGALTGGLGWSKQNNDNDVTSSGQEKYKAASVQYNFGKVKVGAGRLESDAALANPTDMSDFKDRTVTTDSFGITLAASDDLSFGIQYKESSSDSTAWTADEEVTVLSAAYNFGGIGFSVDFAQNDNDGGTRGTDTETLMLRTKTSF